MAGASIEHMVFIQSFDKIVTALSSNLTEIAGKLVAKGLIPHNLYGDILPVAGLTDKQKAGQLVSHIGDVVKSSPQKFGVFVEILRGDLYYEDLVKHLEDHLQKLHATPGPTMTPATGIGQPNPKLYVTRTVCIWMWLPLFLVMMAALVAWNTSDSANLTTTVKTSMTVRFGKDMPIRMHSSPRAVLANASVYIGGGAASREKDMLTVMAYNIQADRWNTLMPYYYRKFSMAIINDTLVLIGGVTAQKDVTDVLGMWDSQSNAWTRPFPPMTTPCHSPTVVSYNNTWLIVAGGNKRDRDELSRVEILDTTTNQWYSGAPLPATCSHVTSAVIGNTWYLLRGYMDNSYLKRVFSVNLDDLISHVLSNHTMDNTPSLWQTLPADTPLLFSTALAYKGALLAVGGELENGEQSADIHMYYPNKNTWV